MNYHAEYLRTYLAENNFVLGVDFHSPEQIKEDGDIAAEVFEIKRKFGCDVSMAMEVAVLSLFQEVGLSRCQAAELCLRKILNKDDLEEFQIVIAHEIALQYIHIFNGIRELRYGLDPDDFESHKDDITKKCKDIVYNTLFSGISDGIQ